MTATPNGIEYTGNTTIVFSKQGYKEEAKETTVKPSRTVEPTADYSATQHITPLHHSSFKLCPFAGVFPKYDIERVFGPSNITSEYLKSNHSPTPSQVNINDMRSRYFSNQYKFDLPFDSTPCSYFYSISNASTIQTIPVMMDSFSYCEANALVMEAVFNMKYMAELLGPDVTLPVLRDEWTATIDGNYTVKNQMAPDKRRNTILMVFVFSDRCSSNNTTIFIHSKRTNFNYTVTPPFLTTFSQHRFYLAACTSINDKVPADQVKGWINYHFYQGVEHFTFYLNGGVEQWKISLAEYIHHGLVNVVDYTFPNHRAFFEQASSLQSCNRRYRLLSDFVLYSDVDEFMVPINPKWRVVDMLNMYDSIFPNMSTFRVYNTFHGCKNYTPSIWSKTYNLMEICSYRWGDYIPNQRWKQFVRPCVTPYVQVHIVTYADTQSVNPDTDMIMVHFKNGRSREPASPFAVNPQVIAGMRHPI